MRSNYKYTAALLVGVILGAVAYWLLHTCDCGEIVQTETVVTITRDTLRKPPPAPVPTGLMRIEKIKPKIRPVRHEVEAVHTKTPPEAENADTGVAIDSAGIVSIPITQKKYETPDYLAYVSGYNPALDSITLYPQIKTVTITNTKFKRPRWSVTVGPGAYYDGDAVRTTYIGVTAGFVLWSK